MPAGRSTGPIWSKKTKGPTIRRLAKGRTRPTSTPPGPRQRRRRSIKSSIMDPPEGAKPHRRQVTRTALTPTPTQPPPPHHPPAPPQPAPRPPGPPPPTPPPPPHPPP